MTAQVLMFTASGLLVRFLKVFEKSNYQSVKWVRYLTTAKGTYQIVRSSLVLFETPRSDLCTADLTSGAHTKLYFALFTTYAMTITHDY